MSEFNQNINGKHDPQDTPANAQQPALPLAVDPPKNLSQSGSMGTAVHYASPQSSIANKEFVTFEGVDQIDSDADLWFKLRGHSINPLADVAMPLFGMVIQARKLSYHQHIPQLYVRVRDEIAALLEEIKQHGYDGPAQLAYCYCLCSFVDEAVMSTNWGAHSIWAERSMLSIYHDETWGGEKFFSILSRMMLEPSRYQDILEFVYYCLSLGFRGKYGVQFDGVAELQGILRRLQQVLREQRGESREWMELTSHQEVSPKPYEMNPETPLTKVWAISGILVLASYFIYSAILGEQTIRVLDELGVLLG
ncbi:MAG: type IVB secretion system protein IcmH/DotU [Methylococcaceae bacterium]